MRRIFFAVLLLVVAVAWGLWATSPVGSEQPIQGSRQPIQVTIPSGTGTVKIGELLQEKQLIRSAWAWAALVFSKGWQNQLKAGTYGLSPNQSPAEIAATVREGKTLTLKYTIPEGWNLKQMAHYFQEQGLFTEAEFLAETQGSHMQHPQWLPPNLDRLEGFLFPSTYTLSVDQHSAKQVVSQMLQSFAKEALPLYQKQPGSKATLKDWVTLASIVEKEAVVDTERPVIAGVFAARLQKRIPLGSDPTVEYAFGIRQTADHPLTYRQVRQPNPYNTYINPGLPPTPIASPGLASLKAALAPANTLYLFFVARYDGTHIFSRTVAEHERAKLQIRSQRQAIPKP
jgi:UPF0755 protein